MSLTQHETVAAGAPGAGALSSPSAALSERPGARFSLDRVVVLDILRGIALIGMFLVHFNYYEATPPGVEPGRLAAFMENVLGLFIEERFWSMFGMLFGVGFAVQLTRAEARGEPFVARYLRRLAALAVFGFIAEGVFGYNVLLGYAMWGVPLLLVRKLPVKALVVLLVLCASSGQLYRVGKMAVMARQPDEIVALRAASRAQLTAFMATRDSIQKLEQSSDWGTVIRARVGFMPKFHWQWNRFPNGDMVLFLLGMICWKLGVFTRPEKRKRLIAGLMVFGVASSFLVYLFPLGGPPPLQPNPDWPLLSTIVTMFRGNGFGLLHPGLLALTYMGIVLLLVAHNRAWLQRLSFFGWAGRMALTNYMTQVILLDTMFTPHGFGLKIPAALVWPSAFALFVAQVYMSRWWLSRFRIGPLEWIWRSVTYWKLQPFRIVPPRVTPAIPAEVAAA